MPDEVIRFLNLVPNGIYVDMTLGDGGHSALILEKLSHAGRLVAFDKDSQAIKRANERLKKFSEKKYDLVNEDFSSVKESLAELGINEVDGILFDLGVSSRQLDEAGRGFSFSKEARLDMRMDLRNEVDAHKLVNELPFEDLYRIIKVYGEERFAKRIARNIINKRTLFTIISHA